MRRFLFENSLSLTFGLIFLATLVGQSLVGLHDFNEEQMQHGSETYSYGRYLVSSEFGAAVLENWQSEYLQFLLFLFGTIWLVQKGSPESKELEKVGLEPDKEQKVRRHATEDSPRWARVGGWRFHLYANSLVLVMGAIFFASWFAQSVTGWTEYNSEQLDHEQPTVSWAEYLAGPDFWEKTFQNWQSEFLAIGSFVVLTIYLRQRGSPESKPVGAPHDATGTTG